MRIPVKLAKSYLLINHGPCPLITTSDGTKKSVAPISWTMPMLDDPPMVITAIEPGVFSDELLQSNGEFAVNIMGEENAKKLFLCGSCTGRDTDKFKKFGLTPVASKNIKPPYLKESIAHIECKVANTHDYDGIRLYAGNVIYTEVEEEYYNGKFLDLSKAKTVHHLSGKFFAVTERQIEA